VYCTCPKRKEVRGSTSHLQVIQRLLYESKDLMWKPIGAIVHQLGGLGLSNSLFLMDLSSVCLNGLPVFYRGLFITWNLFKRESGWLEISALDF